MQRFFGQKNKIIISPLNCLLDDQYYKTLIIEYLKQYSKANRKEINKLLWDKLPDSLSDDQKKHKVHNLLTALKNKNIIEKDGENQRKANWILKD